MEYVTTLIVLLFVFSWQAANILFGYIGCIATFGMQKAPNVTLLIVVIASIIMRYVVIWLCVNVDFWVIILEILYLAMLISYIGLFGLDYVECSGSKTTLCTMWENGLVFKFAVMACIFTGIMMFTSINHTTEATMTQNVVSILPKTAEAKVAVREDTEQTFYVTDGVEYSIEKCSGAMISLDGVKADAPLVVTTQQNVTTYTFKRLTFWPPLDFFQEVDSKRELHLPQGISVEVVAFEKLPKSNETIYID